MAKMKVTPRKHTNETRALWEIRSEQKKTKPAIAKISLARWLKTFLLYCVNNMHYCV